MAAPAFCDSTPQGSRRLRPALIRPSAITPPCLSERSPTCPATVSMRSVDGRSAPIRKAVHITRIRGAHGRLGSPLSSLSMTAPRIPASWKPPRVRSRSMAIQHLANSRRVRRECMWRAEHWIRGMNGFAMSTTSRSITRSGATSYKAIPRLQSALAWSRAGRNSMRSCLDSWAATRRSPIWRSPTRCKRRLRGQSTALQ